MDWIKTAKVGDMVVCVEACKSYGLIKGSVYKIIEIGVGIEGLPMISVDRKMGLPSTPDWYARRFKPTVPRKTDISIFTRMLTKVTEDA